MPLPGAEPHLYPPNLFEQCECKREDRSRWWVLHTRPRAEKCLACGLLHAEKPFFLPIYERRWRSRGHADLDRLQRLIASSSPLNAKTRLGPWDLGRNHQRVG